MNKLILLSAVVFVASIAVAVPVQPEKRLYFSIPLGPAPSNSNAGGSSSGGQSSGGSSSGGSSSGSSSGGSSSGQQQLNIIPLGQVIGNLLSGLFGGVPQNTSGQAQLQIVPFGQAIGIFLQAIFGSGWTPGG